MRQFHRREDAVVHSKLLLNLSQFVSSDMLSFAVRAYYKYMSSLIEPWDGPALIAFTDGEVILFCESCTNYHT